jgi:hypothetical protein
VNRRIFALLLLPLAIVVAACGGSPNAKRTGAAAASSVPSAKEAVLASMLKTTSRSFVADMTVVESLTATGQGAAQLGALAAQPITLSVQMSAESQRRLRVTVSATVGGRPVKAIAVLYDGSLYESTDGGTSFKVIHTTGALPSQFASDNALAYLQSLASVADQGPGTADGVPVERYAAQLDPAKVVALLKSALSSVPNPLTQQLFSSMTFSGAAMEVTVDQQGRLVTEHGPIDVSVDLSGLSPKLAGTHMAVHETVDAHFHDYGAAITVSKPALTSG